MSSYLINYESSKDLKLTVMPDVVSDFSAAPSKFTSPATNPFSLGNNKWRISANHKESRQEIRQRLINHCEFWKTYFSWALDNNIQSVDVRSTPTAIKIYGNGFALKKFDDLPAVYHPNINTDPPFGRGVGDKPALNDAEIRDVIAFLKTLTDGYRVETKTAR